MPKVPKERKPTTPVVERNLPVELAGVVLLFASLFLLLAQISYSPSDSLGGRTIENWAGIVGHWPIHLLVSFGGISSWLLVLIPAAFGWAMIRHRSTAANLQQSFGFLCMLVALSGFADLFIETVRLSGHTVDAGGWLGRKIGRTAVRYANNPGAFTAFALLFLIGFVTATGLSIMTLLRGASWTGIALGKGSYRAGSGLVEWLTLRMAQKAHHKEFQARKNDEPEAQKKPAKGKLATKVESPEDDSSIAELPPLVKKSKVEIVEIRKREVPKLQQELDLSIKAGKFELPPLKFLDYKESKTEVDRKSLEMNGRMLEKKLADFGVSGTVVAVQPGPVVTMYELEPAPGVKVNKFLNLADDLAMAMKAISIRVVAPIPGKNVVGIEIPNNVREIVFLKEIIGSPAFQDPKLKIPIALGKDISGNPVVSDLGIMPHILVAGSTGSGKSVSINAMICSILYRFTPDQVKFVMIDPKMIELSAYDGIPHLRTPVITNPKRAAIALRRCVDEMERRYEMMKVVGRAKDLDMYNRRVAEEIKSKNGQPATVTLHFGEGENRTEETVDLAPLPYWVIIIDELADLMTVAKKDIEDSIARLTAKARAAGLHLIVATQRPSVDVITGVIKSNLPTRLSFQVASAIDSRTILDSSGADSLLGHGDSLFIPPKTNRLNRVHGAYVSEDEIARVVDFLKKQGSPIYDESLLKAKPGEGDEKGGGGDGEEAGERDAMYQEVARFILDSKRASTSAIQRKFKIGYNRAARILDQMQEDGMVGPPNGSNPREILRDTL